MKEYGFMIAIEGVYLYNKYKEENRKRVKKMENNHEIKARELKSKGNNCSSSLFKAFEEGFSLKGDYPAPRSIEGKCGALLTSLYILKQTGHEDRIEAFEKEFEKRFHYTTCIDLMTHERRCSDYVGESAAMLDAILSEE